MFDEREISLVSKNDPGSRWRKEGVADVEQKKDLSRLVLSLGKKTETLPSLRREREREEDAKKTLEESGRVERKEEEEEEGGCQTSVGRFLDLAPTFSLRLAIRFKGLNWPKRFRVLQRFSRQDPRPGSRTSAFIFPSGSASRTKLSPRGETIGGERLASQTQSWDDKWKEISRRVGGRLFLFVAFSLSFLFVFPSWTSSSLDTLFSILDFFIIEIEERKLSSTNKFRLFTKIFNVKYYCWRLINYRGGRTLSW